MSTRAGITPTGSRDAPSWSSLRGLYQWAADPECALHDGPLTAAIAAEFGRFDGTLVTSMRLEDRCRRVASWSARQSQRFRDLAERAEPEAEPALLRRASLGCAPLALIQGHWLQWLSSPARADDPLRLRLLALYASDIGVGRPRASRGSAYLSMLRTLGHAERAVPPAAIALDERIADLAFHLPAVLLAASRRPEDFLGEIVGADLCLRAVGLLPATAVPRQLRPDSAEWDLLDASTGRPADDRDALSRSFDLAQATAALDQSSASAVSCGFHWAFTVLRSCSDALHQELTAACDPAFEMGELIRLRAREAAVYHHDYEVAGRPLAQWLAEAHRDPAPLLERLSATRLVRPGDSARSPLVTALVGERGPMFRIFSGGDLDVIRRWIDALPTPRPGAPAAAVTLVSPPELSPPGGATGAARADPTPADLREAYHLLLRRTSTPAVHRYARAYVRGWLARAAYGVDRTGVPLPARWPREGLHEWLVEQHDRHARAFQDGTDAPLPSREALIDSTVQLAPLTLIDGSWLQGFTDGELATSEIGFSLFDTFWDELGNGEPRLNHPLLYREVLAEMGATPPPTDSVDFARWPRFRDASFELPVYWLAIGRFPRTHLPEVLGLNLAMELSGVGGSYRRARIALKNYGYNTRFVDIHNTIDNIASGHSAWAAKAIDVFMSSLSDSADTSDRDQMWRRVRIGFCSLNPPDGWAARRAQRRVMRRQTDR